MTRVFSFLILVGVVLVVGVLFFQVVKPFLFPLFFAGVLAILFRPVYEHAVRLSRGRPRLAAAALTLVLLLLVLLPLGGALVLAGRELLVFGVRVIDELRPQHASALVSRMEELETKLAPERWKQLKGALRSPEGPAVEPEIEPDAEVADLASELRSEFSPEELARYLEPPSLLKAFDFAKVPLLPSVIEFFETRLSDDQRRALQQGVLGSLKGISSQVYASTVALAKNILVFFMGLFIVTLSLYYFFADGPRILETLERIVPLDAAHQRELYHQFETVCRAVVLATLTSAFVQGLMGGIAYALAGVPWVWLLMLLTMLCAMIPVGGAALVWVPVAIWLFIHKGYLAGGLLAVYGAGGISMVDNLIKPYVIHGRAKLHPLLVFVSVLGALHVVGLWGIFVGPIVAAVFYSLLRILHAELNREGAGELITAVDAGGVRVGGPKGSSGPSDDEKAVTPKQGRGAETAESEPKKKDPPKTQTDASSSDKK